MALIQQPFGDRLEIYYGPTGVGKTYNADKAAPNSLAWHCHKGMTGNDLLFGGHFLVGAPTSGNIAPNAPRGLCNAMERGVPIVLEDINHLPPECLEILMKVCDGKNKTYKAGDATIHIADGFKVIGTATFDKGKQFDNGYNDRSAALLLELVARARCSLVELTPEDFKEVIENWTLRE